MIVTSVFFGMILALGIVDDTNDNSIHIEDDLFQKYDSSSIVKIDGIINNSFANMTVTFPNGDRVNSSVEITRDNSFSSFVYLESDFESGVYTVSIIPCDDYTYDSLVDYFLLTDNDGIIDVTIGKNAAQRCMDMTDSYGNEIKNNNICVNPKITHIPKSFGINFINMDSHTHKMDFGSMETDLILPELNSVIFFDKEGVYKYSCVFHPWINGIITVSDIPSLRYTTLIIPDYTNDVDAENDVVPITPQTDTIPYSYDTSCTNCYIGVITKIVDGDTIHVDEKIIRLSLVDTPESYDDGFKQATAYTTITCPVGMSVLVDIDDLQPHDKWKRSMAKITCEDVNLNAALLSSGNAKVYSYFCAKSEFITEQWGADGCDLNDKSILELPVEDIPIQNNTTLEIPQKIEHVKRPSFEIPFVLILIVVVIIIAVVAIVFFIKKSKPDFDVDNNDDENFVFID